MVQRLGVVWVLMEGFQGKLHDDGMLSKVYRMVHSGEHILYLEASAILSLTIAHYVLLTDSVITSSLSIMSDT